MPLVYLETVIHAAPQLVFDLSRSVDLHKASMTHHQEEIIAGIRDGLMENGDTVTWRARHFWKSRTLKVAITEMEPPHFFIDEMIAGDFTMMRHQHEFQQRPDGTGMVDRFRFETPYGLFGQLINRLFLKNYMTRLLQKRNTEIKRAAETNLWKQYLHV